MRVTLPESARRRTRTMGGTLLSASIHACVIGATVAATGWSAEQLRTARVIDERIIFLPPVKDKPPAPPTIRLKIDDHPPATPPLPQLPPMSPVKVNQLNDVTSEIPPSIEQLGALVWPRDSGSSGSATRTREGVTGRGAGDGAGDGLLTANSVDREVVALRGVSPTYPAMLAHAGVEGAVLMQLVVGTLERVERESMRAVRTDNPLFEQSVRDALARMRFIPAEANGRKVRQLVQQPYTFALTRAPR